VKRSAHNSYEVTAATARVAAALTLAIAAADARVTTAQQQLDASPLTTATTPAAIAATVAQVVQQMPTVPAQTAMPEPEYNPNAEWLNGLSVANGYAGGGLMNGAAMVGELGEEFVDFATPGRVYTAEQTRGMFSQSDLVPIMQALLNEVRELRSSENTVGEVVVAGMTTLTNHINKWAREGVPLGPDMLAENV
jgi:hypothetical protein